MPIYCYKCNSCEERFEVKHSMSFNEQKCLYCESIDIFRIPSIQTNRTNISYTDASQPGKIVNEYIESTRKELNKEKQKLKKEEF